MKRRALDAQARGGGRRVDERHHQHCNHANQVVKRSKEMTASARLPPAPVGQQAPPAHAATRLMGALRVARGSLLLTTGTGSRRT